MGGAGGRGVGGAEKIGRGLGHDHAHDGFAIAGGRDASRFDVSVTTTTNQRGIADAAGEFATGAAGGGGGEEAALPVEGDGADSSLFVAAMIFGGVGIPAAAEPSFAFGGRDESFGIAERDGVCFGEVFGAFGDEHHVGTFFEDSSGSLDGIFDSAETGDRAGAESGGIHDDGVAFDVAVECEMGAETGVEDGIVFENDNGGFDGVERVAAVFENPPARLESAETAGFTGVDSVIGNVPSAAVNDERRLHEEKNSRIGKWGEEAASNEQIAAIRKLGLNEEVEGEEEEAEHEQDGAEGEAALGKADDGVEEAGGDHAEARFGARKIKGADGFIAGEIAAESGEFIFHPEGEFFAVAPQIKQAKQKNTVAKTSQQTKSRTRAPIKHGTSPPPGRPLYSKPLRES